MANKNKLPEIHSILDIGTSMSPPATETIIHASDIYTPERLICEQIQHLEDQLNPLQGIADPAKRQAESAGSIAGSSKIQADLAIKQAQKADIKSWIAITISICALFVEFMAYHKEIFSFMTSLFN